MNQDEERHIGVHHGARELENNVLLDMAMNKHTLIKYV